MTDIGVKKNLLEALCGALRNPLIPLFILFSLRETNGIKPALARKVLIKNHPASIIPRIGIGIIGQITKLGDLRLKFQPHFARGTVPLFGNDQFG